MIWPFMLLQRLAEDSLNISACTCGSRKQEKELFVDNLLVRIHLIIEIILEDRPCAMGV